MHRGVQRPWKAASREPLATLPEAREPVGLDARQSRAVQMINRYHRFRNPGYHSASVEGTQSPAVDRAASLNRYGFVDAIRGFAAMAVVIEHAIESYYGQGVADTQIFSFGQFGVAAFLFVSVFVVPVSLERSQSVAKFWIGRFFRLYP